MDKIVIVILCSLVLIGCLPDPLEVNNVPRLERKIVVSSQMIPNQSIAILLTSSFGALEASDDSDPQLLLDQIAINDAQVIIKGIGFIDTLTSLGNGVYGSVTIPFEEEELYELSVVSPTAGSVTAITRLKRQVTFNTLNANIIDTGFDTLANIDYSFQDLPGKNYYMINVQYISTQDPPGPQDLLNPSIFTSLVEDNSTEDGELIGDSFKVFFRRHFVPGDTILVQMAHIDEAYYNFLQLRQDTRFSFSDFLGEPVNYPSNVEGGLGWFTLHVPDVRIVIIDP